jgi:gliding motility-associated lipoprotein GldH
VENQLHRKMKRINRLLILLLGVILFSCQESPTFEKTYAFENNHWEQKVKPQFVVDIQDTTKSYNFTLTLRTTTDYKYSNLWVYMSTKTPDGKKAREPFEIKVANPDGSWAGKKTGTIVEHTLNFNQRKMPLKGSYTFVVEQGVTNQSIDEVLDIGLLVVETLKAN